MVKVPSYIASNAERGLRYLREGRGGDGLKEKTIREARQMADGSVSEDKVRRMGPWLRRHEGDLDAPKNKNPDDPEYPGAGLVAWLLWGGDANGNMRAAEWAESKASQLDEEGRTSASVDRPGKKKMTLEQLNAKLQAEIESIKADAVTATNKLVEADKILASAKIELEAFEVLKTEAAQKDEALKNALARIAELESKTKPVEMQAAAIAASCGADPAFVTPELPENAGPAKEPTVLEKYRSLSGTERTEFYKANKNAIQAAMLTQSFTPFRAS